MKYKCLVCNQIIDNDEMCPFCGSDSSQIVPIETTDKKGNYRCLVCGKETDNGDYCPYCGSQRLYNLDTNKTEDTTSIPVITEDNPGYTEESFNDFGESESDNSETSEESLESRYFNMFGELLPLDSIPNPDVDKINALYRIGINRGEKITPEEIANTFSEDVEDSADESICCEENTREDKSEIKKETDDFYENNSLYDNEMIILSSIEKLLDTYQSDKLIVATLNELKTRILSEVSDNLAGENPEEELLIALDSIAKEERQNGSRRSVTDQRYLELLKVLLNKVN